MIFLSFFLDFCFVVGNKNSTKHKTHSQLMDFFSFFFSSLSQFFRFDDARVNSVIAPLPHRAYKVYYTYDKMEQSEIPVVAFRQFGLPFVLSCRFVDLGRSVSLCVCVCNVCICSLALFHFSFGVSLLPWMGYCFFPLIFLFSAFAFVTAHAHTHTRIHSPKTLASIRRNNTNELYAYTYITYKWMR